jgi:hypothetical protein
MDQVLDQVLKASSQQEAQDRFDDLRGELAEEAPSALEVLEGGLHEATAVLALPDKYRKRLRTTKRDPAVHPGGPPPGKTDSDLSKRGIGSSACWGPLCRAHEEWSTGRCYFDMEEFFEWKASRLEDCSSEEDSFGDQASSTENSVDRDAAVAA